MTPGELLGAARTLIRRPDSATAGVWPRAAAFLARQALEAAMTVLWAGNRTLRVQHAIAASMPDRLRRP
jgi:hypothetical protein